MRPDVHLQGRQRGVSLGAILARETLLDLVVAVQLLVLCVSGLGGKGLFAIGAVIRLAACAAAACPGGVPLLVRRVLRLERRVEELALIRLRLRQR